jgi:uncharacterized protein YuzE
VKVTYDPTVDVLRILFSERAVVESDEDKPGVMIDDDKDGNIVGMEILDASRAWRIHARPSSASRHNLARPTGVAPSRRACRLTPRRRAV